MSQNRRLRRSVTDGCGVQARGLQLQGRGADILWAWLEVLDVL
jgi:hypothetical protein